MDCDNVVEMIDVNKKLLNIIHFNIHNIKKNFDQFLVFLQGYSYLSYDLIILNETLRITDESYSINGFNMHYSFGYYHQNDGLIIYTNNT